MRVILIIFAFFLSIEPCSAQINDKLQGQNIQTKTQKGSIDKFDGHVLNWSFVNRIATDPVIEFGIEPDSKGKSMWLIVARGTDLYRFTLVDHKVGGKKFGSYAGYAVSTRIKMSMFVDQSGTDSIFFDNPPYWRITSEVFVNSNPYGFKPNSVKKTKEGTGGTSSLVKVYTMITDMSMIGSSGNRYSGRYYDPEGVLILKQSGLDIAESPTSGATTESDCVAKGETAKKYGETYADYTAGWTDAAMQSPTVSAGLAYASGKAGLPFKGGTVVAAALIVEVQASITHAQFEAIKFLNGWAASAIVTSFCEFTNNTNTSQATIDLIDISDNPLFDEAKYDLVPALACVEKSTAWEEYMETDGVGMLDLEVIYHPSICLRYETVWVPFA